MIVGNASYSLEAVQMLQTLIAAALGLPPSHIIIQNIRVGSLVVDYSVLRNESEYLTDNSVNVLVSNGLYQLLYSFYYNITGLTAALDPVVVIGTSTLVSSTPVASDSGQCKGSCMAIAIAVGCGGGVLLLIVMGCTIRWFLRRRRRLQRAKHGGAAEASLDSVVSGTGKSPFAKKQRRKKSPFSASRHDTSASPAGCDSPVVIENPMRNPELFPALDDTTVDSFGNDKAPRRGAAISTRLPPPTTIGPKEPLFEYEESESTATVRKSAATVESASSARKAHVIVDMDNSGEVHHQTPSRAAVHLFDSGDDVHYPEAVIFSEGEEDDEEEGYGVAEYRAASEIQKRSPSAISNGTAGPLAGPGASQPLTQRTNQPEIVDLEAVWAHPDVDGELHRGSNSFVVRTARDTEEEHEDHTPYREENAPIMDESGGDVEEPSATSRHVTVRIPQSHANLGWSPHVSAVSEQGQDTSGGNEGEDEDFEWVFEELPVSPLQTQPQPSFRPPPAPQTASLRPPLPSMVRIPPPPPPLTRRR